MRLEVAIPNMELTSGAELLCMGTILGSLGAISVSCIGSESKSMHGLVIRQGIKNERLRPELREPRRNTPAP